MVDLTDDEILSELGLDAEPHAAAAHSHLEARVIAGFEDIIRFVDQHGRPPQHGADRDIFERLYAVRLDRIRGNASFRALVSSLDTHGLLAGAVDDPVEAADDLTDDELLAELGSDSDGPDIRTLAHVKPRAEIKAAEDVARRERCADFASFAPLFSAVQADLDAGRRETRRFAEDASIEVGEFFILSGQVVYVAGGGSTEYRSKDKKLDRRLRVIFDNGTESDLLMRSLQRALHKDETGRRIVAAGDGPLFAATAASDDTESGTIYVLRSKSNHSLIAPNRELIHKIGVTGGDVDVRVAQAQDDPTYLFADVEVIATYKLFNINRSKLENLLHRFFAPARLQVEIPDRFGRLVKPREWFLVPVSVINEVVERIRDRSIAQYRYDPSKAQLVRAS